MEKTELEALEFFHNQMIYPTVRVRTAKAGGSGLIFYSRKPAEAYKDEDLKVNVAADEFETYVLTCQHVVDDAITFKEEWSPIARRNVKTEVRATVSVEFFEYQRLSRIVGGTHMEADIVAYDKPNDIALLKLRSIKPMEYIATLFPKGLEEDVKIATPVSAVGCSLGHSPVWCDGHLTAKHTEIEQKEYWMTSASTIFGNSGGAVFIKNTGEYIGMSARISAIQLGFGVDIITFLGFFVPIDRIYEFIDRNMFEFLYDPKRTSKDCAEARAARRKREDRKMIIAPVDGEKTASKGYSSEPDYGKSR